MLPYSPPAGTWGQPNPLIQPNSPNFGYPFHPPMFAHLDGNGNPIMFSPVPVPPMTMQIPIGYPMPMFDGSNNNYWAQQQSMFPFPPVVVPSDQEQDSAEDERPFAPEENSADCHNGYNSGGLVFPQPQQWIPPQQQMGVLPDEPYWYPVNRQQQQPCFQEQGRMPMWPIQPPMMNFSPQCRHQQSGNQNKYRRQRQQRKEQRNKNLPAELQPSHEVTGEIKSTREIQRHCGYCKKSGESFATYSSHSVKDSDGKTTCPVLRHYICPTCQATGDNGHSASYCPELTDAEKCQKRKEVRKKFGNQWKVVEYSFSSR